MVLCVGRVPLVAVWLKPSCRWLAPSSGWPLETWREEGEREARWEEREREARWEGREREAALGSSPPPSLGSSPLPTLGSSPLLPGTLGLITGATAGADAGGTLAPGGGTHDPEAWGWGGGRAAAAVPPSPVLTSPSCFSSNQPVSLRGGGGGSALGRRVRARAARDLFREGTVGRVSISRARTISRYMRRCPSLPLQEPPAAVVEPVRGSSRGSSSRPTPPRCWPRSREQSTGHWRRWSAHRGRARRAGRRPGPSPPLPACGADRVASRKGG